MVRSTRSSSVRRLRRSGLLLACGTILVSGSSSGQTATPAAAPTPSRFQKVIDGGGVGVGNLLVTPPRIVLEGNVRNAQVTLINTGPSQALFRVSIVHMKWNEDGQFTALAEPGDEEKLAESLFRFSPRQVLLDSQMGQTVRIQVRVPSGLPHGEYSTRLSFGGVPMTSSGPADAPKPSAVPEAPPVAAPSVAETPSGSARESAESLDLQLGRRARATLGPLGPSAGDRWALQLLLACSPETLNKTLALESGSFKPWFLPVRSSGRLCYRVLSGIYPDRASARAAIDRLPPELRGPDTGPTPVRLADPLKGAEDASPGFLTAAGPAVPTPVPTPSVPPSPNPAPVPPGPEDGGVRISLRALYAINIPVIFRHGSLPLSVTLARLELLPATATAPARLGLRINRGGERSCYGNFTVTWVPRTGAQRIVGRSNSVAVYAGSSGRDHAVPLALAGPDPLSGGLLQVTYVDAEKPNGRLLAQATLALP